MNILKKDKGFTIIEVVLVLAIAGLIFLMVFIALPALQRGQRDTARKSDVGSISSAVTSYTANNRGTFPTTTTLTGSDKGTPTGDKFGGYVTAVSNNTTEILVTASDKAGTSTSVKEGQIQIVQATKCGASSAASTTSTDTAAAGTASQALLPGTSRQFTITTYLEAGGSGTSYCQDS